jgi:hypothetical protein
MISSRPRIPSSLAQVREVRKASVASATLMLKPSSLIISMEVLNHPEPVVVFCFEATFNFVYKLSFAH